jgi:hypothetical protein
MKKAKLFYILLILISLGVILYCTYYLLGGLKEVVVYERPAGSVLIAGHDFIGRQTQTDIAKYFNESRSLITENKINGDLVIITYPTDTLPKNQVHYFIGIMLEGEMAELPSGFEVIELKAKNKLVVYLTMNAFVRPSPASIESLFKQYANEKAYQLQGFFVEIHYQDDSMSVEAWL